MRRRFALRAEILRSLHQPVAEEHLPEAIDRHASRQRILRADKPASQSQPVVRPRFWHRRQHRGNAAVDSLSLGVIGAALQHEGRPRLRQFLHHHQQSQWQASSAAFSPLQLAQCLPCLLRGRRMRLRREMHCGSSAAAPRFAFAAGLPRSETRNPGRTESQSAQRSAELCKSALRRSAL